ncbi:hypothetical protein HA402_011785 [Bradysia odoriphaga]|nr:hypothetical protein HA402_011785 [Bradysia odoriphaga]
MSSWIKLVDSSSSVIEKRRSRHKRTHRDSVPAIIDDDSSDENCDLSSSVSPKKRRVLPLESLTIENENDSSDDCCDVDYNPDGVVLPKTEQKKIKATLPMVVSRSVTNQPSTSHSSSKSRSKSWITWTTTPKSNNESNLTVEIDDSISDSSESSTHTLIDESSTDGSLMQSPIVDEQETVIETQESITPPVAPFIASTTNLPKKRKIRTKKGGLVERLRKVLSQAKSNVLFWQHHRSADLIPPGEIVTVDRVENTYGRKLIHTTVNGVPTIFSLCSRSVDVGEGDVIEVEFDNEHLYKTDSHNLYSYVDKVAIIKKNISS